MIVIIDEMQFQIDFKKKIVFPQWNGGQDLLMQSGKLVSIIDCYIAMTEINNIIAEFEGE